MTFVIDFLFLIGNIFIQLFIYNAYVAFVVLKSSLLNSILIANSFRHFHKNVHVSPMISKLCVVFTYSFNILINILIEFED